MSHLQHKFQWFTERSTFESTSDVGEANLSQFFLFEMADKASGAAVKEALSTKTVLELLEEDDEFEVSYCEESFC